MANKALLVGISQYKIPVADLNGCANDVTNMRDVLLKYFGFAPIFVKRNTTHSKRGFQ